MTFEDLSGVSTAAFSNPYDALIAAAEDDPVKTFEKSIVESSILIRGRLNFSLGILRIAPLETPNRKSNCWTKAFPGLALTPFCCG